MIYMYQRAPHAPSQYMFTDNEYSRYGSNKNYVETLRILLAGTSWPTNMEVDGDRHQLISTFENIEEFKLKFPELLIRNTSLVVKILSLGAYATIPVVQVPYGILANTHLNPTRCIYLVIWST